MFSSPLSGPLAAQVARPQSGRSVARRPSPPTRAAAGALDAGRGGGTRPRGGGGADGDRGGGGRRDRAAGQAAVRGRAGGGSAVSPSTASSRRTARASRPARRDPHWPFDRRGRGDALCGPPRSGSCRQAGAHRCRAADRGEDPSQSGWPAHRGLRRPPARARRQPRAVLP
jgi:hypothetical protein